MPRVTEPRLIMVVTKDGMRPRDRVDGDALSDYPIGSQVEVTLYAEKSAAQLRLFWAILRHVLPNTDFVATDALKDRLMVRAGFVKSFTTLGGGQTVEPHPGSVREMDAPTFQAFFERSMEILATEIVPGLEIERVKRELATGIRRDA
jgi:hypothetical protein